MDINGKVAIVTGGGAGLGEATVRAYIEKGAKVAVFDMNSNRAESLADSFGPDKLLLCNVDVASESSVAEGIAATIKQFGAVHICNNFAGIGLATKTFGKDGVHPLEAYNKLLDVNLVGTFNVARLAAEQMANNEPFDDYGGRGVIINTASISAYEGQIGQVAYSASKGGVVAMTLPMARDLAPLGIRVNAIVPGLIHTPLFDTLPENVYQSLEASVVYPQRLGRPEEVAHLSVMIVENDYINGENIRLDGAIRMQPR